MYSDHRLNGFPSILGKLGWTNVEQIDNDGESGACDPVRCGNASDRFVWVMYTSHLGLGIPSHSSKHHHFGRGSKSWI